MRKVIACAAAVTVAVVASLKVKESQETRRTWNESTDRVD